jgi:hypothetical protein
MAARSRSWRVAVLAPAPPSRDNQGVEADSFDEREFFAAIGGSGARALLIGRRALVALGLPLLTADYDFWLHVDDIEPLNAALAPLSFVPTRAPEEARRVGRYVLENSEHVDILLGRRIPTHGGAPSVFDDVWARRQLIDVGQGALVAIPAIDDLIATKRFGQRPKDAEDIRLLEALRARRGQP